MRTRREEKIMTILPYYSIHSKCTSNILGDRMVVGFTTAYNH